MIDIQVTIKMDGAKKYFAQIPAKMKAHIQTAIKKSAYLVERYGKIEAPVDTGRLRASIFSDIHESYASVGPNVNYAIFVHEGTKYSKANPFMMRGKETAQDEIDSIFDNEIKSAIE